jgi:transposase
MLKTDEWFLIQDLHLKGFSISEIAKQTGHDRKTVKKYLNLKAAPEPQKRPGRKSKLDPFKPYMLDKLDGSSYTAARLYREIKEMGFDGGKTIVKDFVRKVKTK